MASDMTVTSAYYTATLALSGSKKLKRQSELGEIHAHWFISGAKLKQRETYILVMSIHIWILIVHMFAEKITREKQGF